MDPKQFERIAVLQSSGQYEEVIRLSQILLAETDDVDEQASLLIDGIVSCQILGRLTEARQMLGRLQQLNIRDPEGRLNAEFCEPCLLILEKRLEEGATAFSAILQRHGEALKEPRFRYLYEDIQSRRALALVELERYTEALSILREATSFQFADTAEEQEVHFWLGVCLDETSNAEFAKQEFLRVIGFGLKNEREENARYRLAILCFTAGGFAQARQQLETILRAHPDGNFAVASKDLYTWLSATCQQLGDTASAQLYMGLAKKAAE